MRVRAARRMRKGEVMWRAGGSRLLLRTMLLLAAALACALC